MKTLSMNKNLLAALLVTTTLVVSGCSHAAVTPVQTQTKAQLKHNYGVQNVKQALINAAEENGWSVANADGSNMVLTKAFTKKETDKNARGRTWNKVSTTQNIVANAVASDNAYEITLTEQSKAFFTNDMAKTALNKEIHKLQNAISVELVHDIL